MPQLNEPSSIQDFGNKLTTLYYRNQKKGFKFIGDDPENKVIPIPMDAVEAMLTEYNLTGHEDDKPARAYLEKFYLHNRCLLFTEGIWMSETAGVPHALVYKPGTYLNFKIAGMTRLTALTDNASCICVGPDPGDEELGYYRRKVLRVVDQITVIPESDQIDVVVPTQHMYYNGQEVTPGTPFRITKPGILKLKEPGYVVQYWLSDVDIQDCLIDYCKFWVNKNITLVERRPKC